MKISSLLTLLAAAGIPALASAGTISANDPNGDAFANATGANQGQAVGASGWYYNNVRAGAVAGIDGSNPRSGNGSVSFAAPANGKADIEYLPNALLYKGNYVATGTLGRFSSLSTMSYDWYRDPGSAANPILHPSLRVLLDADGNLATTGDRGGLVFERIYNDMATPSGQWVSDTVSGSSKMWNFGLGLGNTFDIDGNRYAHDSSMDDWKAFLPNATIIGFSSGVGSGWGAYTGAVDNIAWTIGGVRTGANFELSPAQVPEPAPLALMAIAAGILACLRRRKTR